MLTKDDIQQIRVVVKEEVHHEVQAEIKPLKVMVGSLQQDVSSLKTDVGSLQQDVSSLKTDVSSLKTDVSSLKTDVKQLRKGQKKIQKDLDTTIKFFDREVTNHSHRITRIEDELQLAPLTA